MALQCLRELFGKCSFGSLKSALRPVLQHFDAHTKWVPPAHFAQTTFKAILYSIPAQNSSYVIQELIHHLEHMSNQQVTERIGVATVLSNIVSIAATTIGPLLLAISNSLMKRLRGSVEYQHSRQCSDVESERHFQETIINALGDFANALPVYQKLEIMTFTMGNIPLARSMMAAAGVEEDEGEVVDGDGKACDAFLQKVGVRWFKMHVILKTPGAGENPPEGGHYLQDLLPRCRFHRLLPPLAAPTLLH